MLSKLSVIKHKELINFYVYFDKIEYYIDNHCEYWRKKNKI